MGDGDELVLFLSESGFDVRQLDDPTDFSLELVNLCSIHLQAKDSKVIAVLGSVNMAEPTTRRTPRKSSQCSRQGRSHPVRRGWLTPMGEVKPRRRKGAEREPDPNPGCLSRQARKADRHRYPRHS